MSKEKLKDGFLILITMLSIGASVPAIVTGMWHIAIPAMIWLVAFIAINWKALF